MRVVRFGGYRAVRTSHGGLNMPVRGDSSEQRWARAHRIAAGEPDPQVRRAFRVRLGLVLVAMTIIGVTAGVSLAAITHPHHRPVRHIQHHPTEVMLIAGFISLGLGAVLVVTGLIHRLRGPRRQRRQRGALSSPMLALTIRERRQLQRQINGKEPADTAVLDISREVATRIQNLQPSPVLFLGAALCFIGNALLNPSSARYVMGGVYAVMGLLLLPVSRIQQRRAARFLSLNPLPAAGIAAP